jgi:hypothetical protein
MLLVLTAASAVTVALVFAAQAGAAGETVFTGHYTDSESFPDPLLTGACGFPVTFSVSISGTFSFRVDSNGNPLGATNHEVGTISESANGRTVTGHTADQFIFFANQEYEVGLNGVFPLPGGNVTIDAGHIVWTYDELANNLPPTIVNGPHDVLEGNLASLCAALTP